MVARVVPVDSFDLVVFGGTGDLARRKLIPALYHRLRDGQMPHDARIIAAARTDLTTADYRALMDDALREHLPEAEIDAKTRRAFLATLSFVAIDAQSEDGWADLAAILNERPNAVRAFYLGVAPAMFGPIAARLAAAGLAGGDARIVVEKPFGHDLKSARALNRSLARHFDERRIYRIDHYLGKETVQNLMALRFGNALFEPLWNAHHVDHVQITVAESVGVGGRGPYYDRIGAMRDMAQNHLLQLLCLTAMEPPARFEPDAVRGEKLKVLRALSPLDDPNNLIRGQYGPTNGAQSYLKDVGVDDSRTESFVAFKTNIENWRWSGVPFYLRTGKRLRARLSEIAVAFKAPPHSIFSDTSGAMRHNVLSIRLQPAEGITLGMTIKDPGPGGMRLTDAELDMTFADKLGDQVRMPDAYERLVMDVIRGDRTLFMGEDEVEAAWEWIDPIIAGVEERGDRPILYDQGSSGPEDALMLMHRDQRRWRDIAD